MNIFQAKILFVKKNKIIVLTGLKTLNKVNIAEFSEEEMQRIHNKELTEIPVQIKHIDPLLNPGKLASYRAAQHEILWNKIENYRKAQDTIKGVISSETKGGFSVVLDIGINAFLPSSHVYHTESSSIVGLESSFIIIGVNRTHKNVIVSRKSIIVKEIEEENREKLQVPQIGEVLKCAVKGYSNGILVDVGCGWQAVIPSNMISYGYYVDMSKFAIGKILEAAIQEVDEKEKKIILSLIALKENPFEKFRPKQQIAVIPIKIIHEGEFGPQRSFSVLFKTADENLLCQADRMDIKYSEDHIMEMIKERAPVQVYVKNVNSESKVILVYTHRSYDEIWDDFIKFVEASETPIFDFIVVDKRNNYVTLMLQDKKLKMPSAFLHYIDTKQKFSKLQKGTTVAAKITSINKETKKVVISAREVFEKEIHQIHDQLYKKGQVDCVLEKAINENLVIVNLEGIIEERLFLNTISKQNMQKLLNNETIKVFIHRYQNGIGISDTRHHGSSDQRQTPAVQQIKIEDLFHEFFADEESEEPEETR